MNAFHSFLQNHQGNIEGIALEDNCALYITEESFEIIGEPEKAWEFYMSDNKLIRQHFDITFKKLFVNLHFIKMSLSIIT